MGAKAPKITAAQRQLEAMQARELARQERDDNVRAGELFTQQRGMMLGTLGENLLLDPAAARPTAQVRGTIMSPSLTEPATVAAERERDLKQIAGGWAGGSFERVRLLTGMFRPRV